MIKKFVVTIEYTDGRISGPTRVLAADRIIAESLMRRRGWAFEEGPRLYSAIAWAVAKRLGDTSEDYEEFLDQLADWSLDTEKEDSDASENPTV